MKRRSIILWTVLILILMVSCSYTRKNTYKDKWLYIVDNYVNKNRADKLRNSKNKKMFRAELTQILKNHFGQNYSKFKTRVKIADNKYKVYSDRWEIYIKYGNPDEIDRIDSNQYLTDDLKNILRKYNYRDRYDEIEIWTYYQPYKGKSSFEVVFIKENFNFKLLNYNDIPQ